MKSNDINKHQTTPGMDLKRHSMEDSDEFSLIEILRMNQRELERQNTELRKTKGRLEDSHSEYSELYDFAPIGYCTLDHDFRIVQINLTGVSMLGGDRERLTNKSFLNFVCPQSRDTFSQHHLLVLQTDEKQTCEIKMVRLDGTEFYVQLDSMRVNGRGAPSLKHRTAITDITRRKIMENALRESKLKNLAILNTIPDIIFIQDKNGIYIDYHAQQGDNPYLHPKSFLGRRNKQILPSAIAEQLDNLFLKTLDAGKMQIAEFSLPANYILRFYETRLVRLGADKVLSIVRDVTEQKQAEKALQAAHDLLEKRVEERTQEIEEINEQLKMEIRERKKMEKVRARTQQMETIGRLASGVAHEVRNPLNSIQAIVAVLNQELGDHREFQACSSHINTQVERLSRLMKDLLELGRQNTQEFQKIDSIPALCQTAINLWKQSHKELTHKVTLTIMKGGDEASVCGDMGKLHQVFINLLDNAAQHSPKNSEIRMEILSSAKKAIRIRVVDQGTGIKPDDLPHVFEPFFTKRHAGTGLGLSIVKNIIENHGGDIKIRNNEPPPGCNTEIMLPVAGYKGS